MKLVFLAALATTNTLAATPAELATLFSTEPQAHSLQISPTGQYISVIMPGAGGSAAVFLDRETKKIVGQGRSNSSYEIGNYQWVTPERIVISLETKVPWQKESLNQGELYAMNADGSAARMIFGYSTAQLQTSSHIKRREGELAFGQLLASRADDNGDIFMLSTPMTGYSDGSPAPSDIALLNINNARVKKVDKTPSGAHWVYLDQSNQPVLASVKTRTDDELHWFDPQAKAWQKIPSDNLGNYFDPLGMSADGSKFVVADNQGGDHVGLYGFDPKTAQFSKLLVDATSSISHVFYSADQKRIYAAEFDDGKPFYALLPNAGADGEMFKNILGAFPDEAIRITSKSDDNRFVVVRTETDKKPGSYYLIDFKAGDVKSLGSEAQQLLALPLQSRELVRFNAADGTKLSGYLTKAAKDSAEKPLLVLVHGGPASRDHWQFDREAHFYSQLGYNVLQVNFRGSSGFGWSHEAQGNQHWGDVIQQDIKAGVDWAEQQGYGKNQNRCIAGASFGAYSAVQSSVMFPDMYRCAIATAGVYDLEMMFKKGDVADAEAYLPDLAQRLGTDPVQLKAQSPIYKAAALKANLLLVHGKYDRRAPIAQANALRSALDDADKPYEWLEFSDESHGFYSPENQALYLQRTAEFLAKHLKQ